MSRKKGSANITTVVNVEPSRCICGSSRRTKYSNYEYEDYSGAGLAFVGIHRRATKCKDCGQARVDREKVYAAAQIALESNT